MELKNGFPGRLGLLAISGCLSLSVFANGEGTAPEKRLIRRLAVEEPAPLPSITKQVTPATSKVEEPIQDRRSILESPVSGAFRQASLQRIVQALAPTGWTVTIDTTRPEIQEGAWNFYTAAARQQALADLLVPLGMTFEFFFDLKGPNGKPSPLLLVADKHPAEEGTP